MMSMTSMMRLRPSVTLWMTVAAAVFGSGTVGGAVAAEEGPGAGGRSAGVIHLQNARRTGYVQRELAPPFHEVWTYRARHKPRPAWREPVWETQRIDFDYAYAISAGCGLVYFASSSDHAVHALDARTGQPRWRFFTEGPVRLAPGVAGGKVYAASDDGRVYCLDGRTGRLIWKYRPPIPDERLIGNEQMISRWPARSGVLVHDRRAYATFGMWSPEGIVVVCLDAETGELLWLNDSSGTKYARQPHYEAMWGVAPHGYLALCGHVLVVPCGRAAPALFDARDGRLLWQESQGLFPGGAWTMTFAELVFTPCEFLQKPNPERPALPGSEAPIHSEASLAAVRACDGQEVFHLNGVLKGVIDERGRMSLIGPPEFRIGRRPGQPGNVAPVSPAQPDAEHPMRLVSIDLKDVLEAAPSSYVARIGSSQGHMVPAEKYARWSVPVERIYQLVQAGSTLIAGGRGKLICYSAEDGRQLWETPVKGNVRDLLLVGSSLLASTTEGEVHCFQESRPATPQMTGPAEREIAVPGATASLVKALLAVGGVAEGYGLVLGDVDEAFLAALAGSSNLTWYWAAGQRGAQGMRERLADAGLYGPRIAIHNVGARALPYADYVANLLIFVVKAGADLDRVSAAELYRVLRPCGGVAVIACDQAMRPAVRRWLAAGGLPETDCRNVEVGVRIQRGPLPGAGAWTHQYADAGKGGASDERLVRLPLKVLWFGSLGPGDIVSRHYRAPAPLALDGFLFVTGMDHVYALDAYNGRILWKQNLPGVGRWPAAYRGGVMAADNEALYVLYGRSCLRLARATGKTLFTYEPPRLDGSTTTDAAEGAEKPIWEYLAVTDDAVVGALGQPNIRRSWWSMAHPANRLLFVLDKATGKLRWTYRPQSAIDSKAIAIEAGRLFLIDGLAAADVYPNLRRRVGKQPARKAKPKPRFQVPGSPPHVLVALDMRTGKQLWSSSELGPRQNSLYAARGVVLSADPVWTGLRPVREGPSVSAFSAEDGRLLWTLNTGAPLPTIVGDTVYLPAAHDLRTGKPLERPDPLTGRMAPYAASVTGGCGRLSGCPGVLMKRSGSLGFFDLEQLSGVYHHPNVRAGCWINMIPACGLVLVPEGSSSCPCAYNYKTSLALMPAGRHNHWGLYTASRDFGRGRIKHLRLNFGAPGDKADADGDVWFAFPRPSTRGPLGAGGMGHVPFVDLPVEAPDLEKKVTAEWRNPDWTPVTGTDRPWLMTSVLSGPLELKIPMGPPGVAAQPYRVTLYFYNLDGRFHSSRFDVELDGAATGAQGAAAGETGRAPSKTRAVISVQLPSGRSAAQNRPVIKQLTLDIADELTVKLNPTGGVPPVISGMEIQQLGKEQPRE